MKKKMYPHKAGLFLRPCGWRNKAQSILEYAVVIVCVVAALLAMQVYIKRGMQGRWRQVGDELGQQYSPTNTTGTSTLSYSSNSTTDVRTLSEKQFRDKYCNDPNNPCSPEDFDLNGDGVYSDNVFGTETMSLLNLGTTTQKGNETVGKLESSLF